MPPPQLTSSERTLAIVVMLIVRAEKAYAQADYEAHRIFYKAMLDVLGSQDNDLRYALPLTDWFSIQQDIFQEDHPWNS